MEDLETAMRRIALASVLILLLLAPAAADEADNPTITVIGARVHPIKAKGKAWDADHGAIPFVVYHQLGGLTGFPPLTLLSLRPGCWRSMRRRARTRLRSSRSGCSTTTCGRTTRSAKP